MAGHLNHLGGFTLSLHTLSGKRVKRMRPVKINEEGVTYWAEIEVPSEKQKRVGPK